MATVPVPQFLRSAWQDFSGGLNTKESALHIAANQATELTNMEVNNRGLVETGKGYLVAGSPFPNAAESFIRMITRYRKGASGVDRLVVAALDGGNTHASKKVDLKATDDNGGYVYIGHAVGTATFTLDSPTVTGIGTAWDLHVTVGDKVRVTGGTTWYTTTAVSATSLTLSVNFAEAMRGLWSHCSRRTAVLSLGACLSETALFYLRIMATCIRL